MITISDIFYALRFQLIHSFSFKALFWLSVLLLLAGTQESFSNPVTLDFQVEDSLDSNFAGRDARFFGLFRSSSQRIADYNPYAYYGYGYRPFFGNFGGSVGFFG